MAKVNPKQLAVDHGEKMAFGLIVVLVLLALVGTNWSPYEKSPADITSKVADAEAKITVTTWPEEEQQAFVLDESEQPARIVDAGINDRIPVAPAFLASQTLTKDKEARDDPLQEPVLQPVVDMIASSARVLIELPPDPDEMLASAEGSEDGEPGAGDKEEPAEDERPDEFQERSTSAIPGAAMPGAPGAPAFGMNSHSAEMPGEMRDYSSMYAPELMMTSMMPGMEGAPGMYGAEGMYGSGAPAANGKGYPFVSVRGVFEFKDQVRKYTEAIHKGYAQALLEFEIIDFQLERQQLVAAPDTWTEWELVDTQVFRDVVNEAAGLDPDVIDARVTDSAITCPLPLRLTGVWNKQATHPRLTKFELTDEQIERERAYNHALISKFFEQEDAKLAEQPVQKRGFADMVFDSRQLQQSYMGLESAYDMNAMMGAYPESTMMQPGQMPGYVTGNPGAAPMDPELEKFAKELASTMGTDSSDPKVTEKLTEWIKERAQAAGELLLFRYLDFNVDPGKTYRYRVRLELKNPNYGRPLAAAGGLPHVVEGETRPTPWSEPTPPVTVEETVNYFLTRIEPPRTRIYPEARMNVFQYDQDAGTTVQQEVEVAFGQHVGGKTKAKKADPTEGTFEETDYTFRSDDVLIDAVPDLAFKSSEHPDLKLSGDSRGYTQMTEYAIVVTDEQRLASIDPKSRSADLKRQQQLQEWQDEYFAYLERNAMAPGAAEGDYASYYTELYGEPMAADAGEAGSRRGRNSLRRGQSGPGAMPGAMPAMPGAHGAMPAMPADQPPPRRRR